MRRGPNYDTRVVYFIENPDTGLIKIGTTANLAKRLSDLKGSSGVELKLLGSMTGDRHVEAGFHTRWAEQRVRGEWFRPCQDLLEWIEELPYWKWT